jgi:hypothetical protein
MLFVVAIKRDHSVEASFSTLVMLRAPCSQLDENQYQICLLETPDET